jgi:hypothetical protein
MPQRLLIMEGITGAPSERTRTASEIPIEVNLTDEDAVPVYMTEKVLHLRRLGMPYDAIADRLGVNLWMAKKAARWGRTLPMGS